MTEEFLRSLIHDTDTCIVWSFGVQVESAKTYPKINYSGKVYNAHVLVYILFNGPLLPGEIVRHTCDRTFCINPKHLVKGSFADNSSDMVARGRASGSKLSIDQVKEIRASNRINANLAKDFNISSVAVGDIKRGKSYKFNYNGAIVARKERFLKVVRELREGDGVTHQKQVIFDAIKRSPDISRTDLMKCLTVELKTKSSVEAIYAYYRREMLEQGILLESIRSTILADSDKK